MVLNDHLPCPDPDCGSSDAFTLFDSGWGKCHSCNQKFPPTEDYEAPTPSDEPTTSTFSGIADVFRDFKERALREATIARYKVSIGNLNSKHLAKYPLFNTDGEHIGNKVRYPNKGFSVEGCKIKDCGLYGRHAFTAGSARSITVTEGQDDAMAVHQMTGGKYPAVSVHSASSAVDDIKRDFEYLNSFDTVVICFDNDEHGKRAAKAVADECPFPLGKLKIMTPRKFKDASDYLLASETDAFQQEWWQAPVYTPDGLKLGSQMWDEIITRQDSFSVDYPFPGLNKLTYGIRLSELVVLTAETGIGKTSIIKHIEHMLLTDETVKGNNYGVGFLHLEEPNGDTALGLLSIHNGAPYHLPDTPRPEAELRQAFDEVINNERVVIWDHFGSNTVDAVLNKIRHMVALGCKYIVLDHLSIVVSDQSGDERKQLDEITTKIKTLCMELDVAVIAVVHTNRQGQIRGTAGVEQLANIVIRLERDKSDLNEWRRNITRLSVEKNRFSGYTGPASYLWYNKDTSRLIELDEDGVNKYVQGDSFNDGDVPF
jgi:twinkle protein